MSENWKPTAGPWSWTADWPDARDKNCLVGGNGDCVLQAVPDPDAPTSPGIRTGPWRVVDGDSEEEIATAAANARLIAEAGTVYHETGLSPRQLAEQRDKLVEALRKIESAAVDEDREWNSVDEALDTIACMAFNGLSAIAKATATEESNG